MITVHNVLLQFEATVERKQNEIDELSERLQQQHETHQQSVTVLENECQLKVDEVVLYVGWSSQSHICNT